MFEFETVASNGIQSIEDDTGDIYNIVALYECDSDYRIKFEGNRNINSLSIFD